MKSKSLQNVYESRVMFHAPSLSLYSRNVFDIDCGPAGPWTWLVVCFKHADIGHHWKSLRRAFHRHLHVSFNSLTFLDCRTWALCSHLLRLELLGEISLSLRVVGLCQLRNAVESTRALVFVEQNSCRCRFWWLESELKFLRKVCRNDVGFCGVIAEVRYNFSELSRCACGVLQASIAKACSTSL